MFRIRWQIQNRVIPAGVMSCRVTCIIWSSRLVVGKTWFYLFEFTEVGIPLPCRGYVPQALKSDQARSTYSRFWTFLPPFPLLSYYVHSPPGALPTTTQQQLTTPRTTQQQFTTKPTTKQKLTTTQKNLPPHHNLQLHPQPQQQDKSLGGSKADPQGSSGTEA